MNEFESGSSENDQPANDPSLEASVAADFQKAVPLPTTESAYQGPVRPPGPGLPESLGWVFSCFMAQVVASIFAVIVYVLYQTAVNGVDAQAALENMQKDFSVGLIAIVQAGFVLFALIAVTLRVGRPWAAKLNLSPIDPLHFVMILVVVIPLSQVSGVFYLVGSEIWSHVLQVLPGLSFLDEMNAMEMVGDMAGEMSLPVMLLLIAVAPAIAEELMFRGLIGRGLIARWGLFWGIAITSILFAALHVHPAHAFGVLPLGIAMHVVYITTRSFWAPVLLHFVNNAMATLAAKWMNKEEMKQAVEGAGDLSIPMVIAATATVLAVGYVLWKTRVQHILSDGTVWDPGYPTVERPPIELQTRVARGAVSWIAVALVLVCVMMFFGAGAMEGMERLAK